MRIRYRLAVSADDCWWPRGRLTTPAFLLRSSSRSAYVNRSSVTESLVCRKKIHNQCVTSENKTEKILENRYMYKNLLQYTKNNKNIILSIGNRSINVILSYISYFLCLVELPTQKLARVCAIAVLVRIRQFSWHRLLSAPTIPIVTPIFLQAFSAFSRCSCTFMNFREQDSSGQLHIFRSSGNTELEWMSLASAHAAWSKSVCVCGCQCLHSFTSFHRLNIYHLYIFFHFYLSAMGNVPV